MTSESRADWTPGALGAEIRAFLAAHHTMSLATAGETGAAHAASLLYAPDGLALVWTSERSSRHSMHLEARPRVSATIAPDYGDFAAIRGVQIAGAARLLTGPAEIMHSRGLLATRYPFLARLESAPEALRRAWEQASFYRLEPERMTLIDNSIAFGHKATLKVDPDGRVALA